MYTFGLESPIGFWSITTSDSEVLSVDYEGHSPLTERHAETKLEQRVECMLKRYFQGENIDFSSLPIHFPSSGPRSSNLTTKVMQRILQIPHGEVYSYQWLAEQLDMPRAPRAIGGALGRNPIPIIVPCHRIVAKHGKLGGFMQGCAEGASIKSFLLELEGHRFEGLRLVSPHSPWQTMLV